MDFQTFKTAVIARAEELGITEYELYYQAAESVSVEAFRHEVSEFSASNQGGVCFRCIVSGKMGYASTESLSEEEAAAIVGRAVDNASVLEADEPVFLNAGGMTYASVDRGAYDLPQTDALIDAVLDTQEKLYAADPRVIDGCAAQGICETSRLAICNSKGLDLSYESSVSGLVIGAMVGENGEMANDYQIKLGALDAIDTDALVQKAVVTAIGKLGGDVAPTAVCPVVFDPEAMSNLLGVFSSVFSSEAAQKGLSRLAGKEGEVIASPLVTLVDDPFHPDNPMPMPFDAEGSPTAKKNVIEKGVLTTLLYNLKTAAVAGKTTTGNASKAGYDAKVAVRPFTMYLAPGGMTEEELLKKAGSGVYINSVSGLHAGANAVTGDFSLQSAGFMIENGEKTTPVKSFTVAGNFFELLHKITAVADNARLPMALGMTAFGSPSVLVQDLSVAGK